jgi:hypothetical protein
VGVGFRYRLPRGFGLGWSRSSADAVCRSATRPRNTPIVIDHATSLEFHCMFTRLLSRRIDDVSRRPVPALPIPPPPVSFDRSLRGCELRRADDAKSQAADFSKRARNVSSEPLPRNACTASRSFNPRSAEKTMVQLYRRMRSTDDRQWQFVCHANHLGCAGICGIRTLECTFETYPI